MPANKKTAWEIAAKLLAGRDFSRSEMEERLARRGFENEEIQTVIEKLLHYNYIIETGEDINQLALMAEEYLMKKNKSFKNKNALRSLEAFLLRKGFDHNLVTEYLERLTGF